MSIYLDGIKTVLFYFPFIAFVVLIPLLIFSYQKYGAFSFWRALLIFSFLFYILCALALIIYPLPDLEVVAKIKGPTMQLRPFTFVRLFLKKSVLILGDPSTYLPALKQSYVFQPVFNILMTIPFGMYMRYMFKKSFPKTVFFTFLLSLSFELIQLSALFGTYPRPYRLFDVDDMMLNTIGGALGYFAIAPFLRFLPTDEMMEQWVEEKSFVVSFTRRALALCIDYFFIFLLSALTSIMLDVTGINKYDSVFQLTISFIYFIIIPIITDGQTLGKKLTNMRVVMINGDPVNFKAMFIRGGLLHFVYPFIARYGLMAFDMLLQSPSRRFSYAGLFLAGLLIFIPLISIIYHAIKSEKRLTYELLSKTLNVSNI